MALQTNITTFGDDDSMGLPYDSISATPALWAVEFTFVAATAFDGFNIFLDSQLPVSGGSAPTTPTETLEVTTTNVSDGDVVLLEWDAPNGVVTFTNVTQSSVLATFNTLTPNAVLYPWIVNADGGTNTFNLSIASDTTLISNLSAGYAGFGDNAGAAGTPGVAGSRTTTVVEDGLTTVTVDALGYTEYDVNNNLVTVPEVTGSPSTTGTYSPATPYTYTHIVSPAITEVRVTLNGVTNITKTTDAYIDHTEVADATATVGDDLLAIDETIDGTYSSTATTPGGYTSTDVNHNQIVETSQESAISCIDRQVLISGWVNANEERMQAVFLTNDVNAHDLGATTDIGARLRSLGHDRSSVVFHPDSVQLVDRVKSLSTERPDAALIGTLATTKEGARQFDYNNIVGASDSCLSESEQQALIKKGYNFVETFKRTTFTHVFRGRTVTSREMRIQWGADWIDINIESDLATYAFGNDLMAFDEETFADVEAILYVWRNKALDRRIIVDTVARPSTITLPDPDSFSAADRASGIATIHDAYCWALNSAIDEWQIRGKIKLNTN